MVDEPVDCVGDNAAAPGGERLLSMAQSTLLRRFVIVYVGREGDMSSLGEVARYVDGVHPRGEESLGEVARYVDGVRPRGEEVQDSARSNSARAVARIVAGSLGPGPVDTSAIWGGNRPSREDMGHGDGSLDQYAVDHRAVDYFVDATGVRW